jgi:hypothetical protein
MDTIIASIFAVIFVGIVIAAAVAFKADEEITDRM